MKCEGELIIMTRLSVMVLAERLVLTLSSVIGRFWVSIRQCQDYQYFDDTTVTSL